MTTKEQNIAKLKQLGVWEQWNKNVEAEEGKNSDWFKDKMLQSKEFKVVISGAFIWTATPEGSKFWITVWESKSPLTTGQKIKAHMTSFFTGYFGSKKVEDFQIAIVIIMVIVWIAFQTVRFIIQNFAA